MGCIEGFSFMDELMNPNNDGRLNALLVMCDAGAPPAVLRAQHDVCLNTFLPLDICFWAVVQREFTGGGAFNSMEKNTIRKLLRYKYRNYSYKELVDETALAATVFGQWFPFGADHSLVGLGAPSIAFTPHDFTANVGPLLYSLSIRC